MGNNPLSLYAYAEEEKIDVDWIPLRKAPSLSLPLPDGTYAIAIDPWRMDAIAAETVCLAHELGHCKMGAFYNQYATCDIRKKHENQADKWAIRRLISPADLDDAVAEGCDSIFALAEHFGVTEDFMRKAVCYYTYGNLDDADYLPM